MSKTRYCCSHSSVEKVGDGNDHLLLAVAVQVREHGGSQNMSHRRLELLDRAAAAAARTPRPVPSEAVIAGEALAKGEWDILLQLDEYRHGRGGRGRGRHESLSLIHI